MRRTKWRFRRTLQKRELKSALHGRPAGSELFTRPQQPLPTRFPKAELDGDLIHMHWITNWLDYPSFFSDIPVDRPIVWTLHDMNPFTGGCHYSGGCDRFCNGCGDCPQLGKSHENDLSRSFFRVKQQSLAGKQLHIVGPSRWICQQARKSGMFGDHATFHHIANGLDTAKFHPVDKPSARSVLGLEKTAFVVGFGAETISNRRKGGHHLIAALKRLHSMSDMVCLTFGSGQILGKRELPPIKSLGHVATEEQLVYAYSAMDVFVMPSLEDNLPQTGLEAMACGTPVVAFEVGGVPDYVRPHETGLLAPAEDPGQLAVCIDWMWKHPERRAAMADRGRELCLQDFNAERQAERYAELYKAVIAQSRRARPSQEAA